MRFYSVYRYLYICVKLLQKPVKKVIQILAWETRVSCRKLKRKKKSGFIESKWNENGWKKVKTDPLEWNWCNDGRVWMRRTTRSTAGCRDQKHMTELLGVCGGLSADLPPLQHVSHSTSSLDPDPALKMLRDAFPSASTGLYLIAQIILCWLWTQAGFSLQL